MTSEYAKTPRNQVKRLRERGHYDVATIYPIIDEALICHVGFVLDEQPFVIPTIHARVGDTILLHGAKASRMLRHLEAGGSVCITCTLIDGIVLARSVFHHSMNYRSAVVFGQGQPITDEEERLQALEAFTERLMAGRWADVRPPNKVEMKQTTVVAVPIESASAKMRIGPPKDDEEDYDLPVWAGVLPLAIQPGAPIADARLRDDIAVPAYINSYRRDLF